MIKTALYFEMPYGLAAIYRYDGDDRPSVLLIEALVSHLPAIGRNVIAIGRGGTVIAANNIVRFNTTTNLWSKLGTGAGNGLDSSAFALAASGSDLYAGGQFRQANIGGAGGDIPSSFIARFSVAPPTVTQVTSSLNPSADTQNVNFTATITASGAPVNDGCVTFKEAVFFCWKG